MSEQAPERIIASVELENLGNGPHRMPFITVGTKGVPACFDPTPYIPEALSQALVAAKLHEAAKAVNETYTTGRPHGPKGTIAAILALIDTDHQAALDAYVRREVEKERERILAVVDSWHDAGNKPCDTIVMKIAAAIRGTGQ